MINYESFKKNVLPRIKELAGSQGYEVSQIEVFKINFKKEGLVFRRHNCGPVIYLDEVYDIYIRTSDVFETVRELLDKTKKLTISDDFLNDYLSKDYIMENVTATLINSKANCELLSSIPNIQFQDMSIVYRVACIMDNMECSYYITKNILQDIGLCEDDLYEIALENTCKTSDFRIDTLNNMVKNLHKDLPEENLPSGLSNDYVNKMILVITNASIYNAPTTLLHRALLKCVGEIYGTSYYVIPSSIHEVITVSADKNEYTVANNLRSMLRDINSTLLSQVDILSNEVFFYDRKEGRLIYAFDGILSNSAVK